MSMPSLLIPTALQDTVSAWKYSGFQLNRTKTKPCACWLLSSAYQPQVQSSLNLLCTSALNGSDPNLEFTEFPLNTSLAVSFPSRYGETIALCQIITPPFLPLLSVASLSTELSDKNCLSLVISWICYLVSTTLHWCLSVCLLSACVYCYNLKGTRKRFPERY